MGAAAEVAAAFSGARKNHLDLSVGIALGSATQIALFVAPVLVLTSYVGIMLLATLTVALVGNLLPPSGH